MISDTRGVSEILGYILVFSLVLASIALVSTVGLNQIQDVRDVEQMNNAEDAFDLLATNLDDIARRGAPSRSTEMQLAHGQLAIAEPITIEIRAVDEDDQNNTIPSENYTVWPIQYSGTDDDREVRYTAGAVFRSNGDSVTAIKAPPIVADNNSINIPILRTNGESLRSLGGGTARIRASRTNTKLLISDHGSIYEKFYMNVTSEHTEVWNKTLSNFEAFDCEPSASDQVSCYANATEDQLHVVIVDMDISLHN